MYLLLGIVINYLQLLLLTSGSCKAKLHRGQSFTLVSKLQRIFQTITSEVFFWNSSKISKLKDCFYLIIKIFVNHPYDVAKILTFQDRLVIFEYLFLITSL